MFIPNFLLNHKKDPPSTEIQKETIEQHQNLLKIYYNSFKQLNKTIEREDLQKNVYDWIFSNNDIHDTAALLCLDNNYSTKFINYLFKKIYEKSNVSFKLVKSEFEKIMFTPKTLEESGKLIDMRFAKYKPKLEFYYQEKLLQKFESTRKDNLEEEIETILTEENNYNENQGFKNYGTFNSPNKSSPNKEQEDKTLITLLFIQSLQFFNGHSFNDFCTLENELCSNKDKFKDFFNSLSNHMCFKSFPKCHFYSLEVKNEKIYNLDLPEWFDYSQKNHAGSFVIAIFEQTIMIRYAISLIKKINSISRFTSSLIISSRIADFYVKRKNIIKFFDKRYSGEKRFKEVRFKNL